MPWFFWKRKKSQPSSASRVTLYQEPSSQGSQNGVDEEPLLQSFEDDKTVLTTVKVKPAKLQKPSPIEQHAAKEAQLFEKALAKQRKEAQKLRTKEEKLANRQLRKEWKEYEQQQKDLQKTLRANSKACKEAEKNLLKVHAQHKKETRWVARIRRED